MIHMFFFLFIWVKSKRRNIGLPLLNARTLPQLGTHFISGVTNITFAQHRHFFVLVSFAVPQLLSNPS